MAKPNMLDRDEVFRRVFMELRIPMLAIDLPDLLEFVAHPKADEGANYSVRLDVPRKDRRSALVAALRGLIGALDVPGFAVDLFARSNVFAAMPQLADRLRALAKGDARWAIAEHGDYLRWDELSPWPAGFRRFLGHLSRLIWGYAQLLEQRRETLDPDVIQKILDQASRVLPTRHHYAAASLGAWLGGATNVQYFSFFATDPQCRNPGTNKDYAKRIHYNAADAEALTRSGIIAVPATLAAPLLNAQEDGTILGAIPIDEWSAVNLPDLKHVEADRKDIRHPGFLIDKYYRAPFVARPLEHRGLYGRNNVLRDHYEDFYARHATGELVRCKHYCAPVIEVRDQRHLAELIADIPLRAPAMHFRGQTSFYELSRDPCVRALLFGSSISREPSLITSAARGNFDYDSLHFALRYFIQDRIFGTASDPIAAIAQQQAWHDEATKLTSPLDYAVMALAQHYGLPSHGLDVTEDIDVAIWFATNRFAMKDGLSSFSKMARTDWATDAAKWPVIFTCQQVTHSLSMSTQSCAELEMFGVPALRPQRQRASFFLGGHSDHQNRMAEAVLCAFRLAPNDWSTACDFDLLFPPPEEDLAYAAMLDFAAIPEFASLGADRVARYHR